MARSPRDRADGGEEGSGWGQRRLDVLRRDFWRAWCVGVGSGSSCRSRQVLQVMMKEARCLGPSRSCSRICPRLSVIGRWAVDATEGGRPQARAAPRATPVFRLCDGGLRVDGWLVAGCSAGPRHDHKRECCHGSWPGQPRRNLQIHDFMFPEVAPTRRSVAWKVVHVST